MALRDIQPQEMLQIAELYSTPGGVRDLLGQHVELSNYPEYFAEVAAALKEAQALVVRAETERRDAYKGTQTSVEAKLERVLRQTWFTLEAAKQVEDGTMAADAERLTAVLLPDGRQGVNYSVARKVGEAQLADDRAGPAELKMMRRIRGPGGTLSDLHEQRMEYAAVLHGVEIKLLELGVDLEVEANTLAAARRRWMRTVVMLESQVDFLELDLEARHTLLHAVHGASERGERRRSARASGESAAVAAVVASAVDSEDTLERPLHGGLGAGGVPGGGLGVPAPAPLGSDPGPAGPTSSGGGSAPG